MNFNKHSIEKFLNYLLVFLLPTQLAYHFWPSFSSIFGIRVDYLSPAIYLTDILFFVCFVLWFFKDKSVFIKDLTKNKRYIFVFLALALLNSVLSISVSISLLKWLKVGELLLFGYFVFKRKDIFTSRGVSKILFYSLIFFSVVGVAQFIRGRTGNGIFYIFGERDFSLFTPGIAITNFFGNNFLRIYSTFSHPNSFAGYLGLFILFYLFTKNKFNRKWEIFAFLLIVINFLLTFSLSGVIGILTSFAIYIFCHRKENVSESFYKVLFPLLFVGSLFLLLSSKSPLLEKLNLSESSKERIQLSSISGNIISEKYLFGSGLNTFILKAKDYSITDKGVWILQPVHNVYLLLLSEVGIVGVIFVFLFLSKLFGNIKKEKRVVTYSLMSFVLVTSLFDHYWLTLHQNLFLLSLFLGIIARDKTK